MQRVTKELTIKINDIYINTKDIELRSLTTYFTDYTPSHFSFRNTNDKINQISSLALIDENCSMSIIEDGIEVYSSFIKLKIINFDEDSCLYYVYFDLVDDKNTSLANQNKNNGGETDYYKLNPNWKMLQDIIEDRNMNFSQGNIIKVAFTFNVGRHDSTNYERELNKIIYFANRELEKLKKQ